MAAPSEHVENNGTESLHTLYGSLRPYLDDDAFQQFARHVQGIGPGSGRGRPCNLPPVVTITNRLLLQFGLLRELFSLSWSALSQFADKMVTVHFGHDAPRLDKLIPQAERKVGTLATEESILEFLDSPKDFVYPKNSPFCKRYNVTKAFLLGTGSKDSELSDINPTSHRILPNGLLIELDKFKTEQHLSSSTVHSWITVLCPDYAYNSKQLNKKISDLMKKHCKVGKDKKRKPEMFSSFMESDFLSVTKKEARSDTGVQQPVKEIFQDHLDEGVPSTSTASEDPPPSGLSSKVRPSRDCDTSSCSSCSQTLSQLESVSSHVLELKMRIEELQIQPNSVTEDHVQLAVASGLREAMQEKSKIIASLSVEIDLLKKQLAQTKKDQAVTLDKLKEKTQECAQLRRNATNVRRSAEALKRRESQLARNLEYRVLYLRIKRDCDKLQFKIKASSEQEKKLKSILQETTKELREVKSAFKTTSAENETLNLQVQDKNQPVCITKENRRYTDAVQVCAAQLVGELDIAAARVPEVMQCVARHLFETEINSSDLPSKSTVFRYVDTAHAVAKMHIGDELQTHRFDLHTDGTSRDRKKYVGQQVTLENKRSLSCGFHRVSTENAQTLTDVTMALITEVSSMMTDDDTQLDTTVKKILGNMTSMMSDRASVMKAFNHNFDTARKQILSTDIGLEFLYCNAHFLLGLSAAAEKALSGIEVIRGLKSKLGRDTLPAFGHFNKSASEPAAVRVLRTACDILGPRGDDKNGCREHWLGFCLHKAIHSCMTSFRGNRFNNTFEGAAAIIHHLPDILVFLQEFMEEKPNLKIRSVLADLQDEQIVTMLAALATVYVCISGPFWVLINSNVHYLDLHVHVKKMKASLQTILDDDEQFDKMTRTLPCVLDNFFLEKTPVVQSVIEFVQHHIPVKDLFKDVVLRLCQGFVDTIDRQLSDFLPGGRYSTVPTEEARQKMAHCRTSNLLGEACLGDLDFSLNKRRYASSFHHSTINMLKRNKPYTSWFSQKSEEEQKTLMQTARQKGVELRSTYREKEKSVCSEDKAKVIARAEARTTKEAEERAKRFNIIRELSECPLRGPCLYAVDVDTLMTRCPTLTAKREALKLQLRYYRIVMATNSPLLIFSKKTLGKVATDLKSFLQELNPHGPPPRSDPANIDISVDTATSNELPTKRRRVEVEESDSDRETEETEEHAEETFTFDGIFTRQAETVAVFYDEQCFIGEVLEVHSGDRATVTFMKQDGNKNSFSWPSTLDLDDILARFIVQWNLDVTPSGQQGRKWSVRQFEELQRRYFSFKSMFA